MTRLPSFVPAVELGQKRGAVVRRLGHGAAFVGNGPHPALLGDVAALDQLHRRKRKDRAPAREARFVNLTGPFIERHVGFDGLHDLVHMQLPIERHGQRSERGVVHGGDEMGRARWFFEHTQLEQKRFILRQLSNSKK